MNEFEVEAILSDATYEAVDVSAIPEAIGLTELPCNVVDDLVEEVIGAATAVAMNRGDGIEGLDADEEERPVQFIVNAIGDDWRDVLDSRFVLPDQNRWISEETGAAALLEYYNDRLAPGVTEADILEAAQWDALLEVKRQLEVSASEGS